MFIFGIVLFVVTLVILVVVFVTLAYTSNQSILTKYNINGYGIDRPRWWTDAINRSKISGQDGASANWLPDGNVMWLFGDTVLNCTECGWGWKMITNTALILNFDENGTVTSAYYLTANTSYAEQVVPYEDSEQSNLFGIWPGAAVLVNDTVYAYWEVINRGNGPWGFSHYAYGKGELAYETPTAMNFTRVYPDNVTDPAGVDHSLLSNDGKYVYGYVLRGDDFRDVILSRTPVERMNQPYPEYTWWTGKIEAENETDDELFSSDVSYSDTKSLVGDWGAQISVEWNEYIQQYCMLGSGSSMEIRTSPNPWGPWSKPVDVFDVPADILGDGFAYCAYFHPELWREKGRVMVFTYCVSDSGDGKPYLVEVALEPKVSTS